MIRADVTAALVAAAVPALSSCMPRHQDLSAYPVLFVHGSGLSSDSWRSMKNYLRKRGYPEDYLLAIDLPRYASNVEAAKQHIAPSVEALLSRVAERRREVGLAPLNRIDMLTHSMGAFSARWYVAKIGAHRVRRLIALAPANHGSNALCSLRGQGNREMCPAFAVSATESAVQIELNGSPGSDVDETPWGVGEDSAGRRRVSPDQARRIEYYTVRLARDPWIVPAESALLDGAGGDAKLDLDDLHVLETTNGNFLLIGDYDHDSLPRSQRVMDLAYRLLSAH
jgi:pimeloyl-ACP methyl ester carboxylesterase